MVVLNSAWTNDILMYSLHSLPSRFWLLMTPARFPVLPFEAVLKLRPLEIASFFFSPDIYKNLHVLGVLLIIRSGWLMISFGCFSRVHTIPTARSRLMPRHNGVTVSVFPPRACCCSRREDHDALCSGRSDVRLSGRREGVSSTQHPQLDKKDKMRRLSGEIDVVG